MILLPAILSSPGCVGNGINFPSPYAVKVTDLNAVESVELIRNKKKLLILDLRSEQEMKSKHDFLVGATMIPKGDLAGRLGEIAGYGDKKVQLACPCGIRSRRAAEVLAKEGFAHAYNIAAPGNPGLVGIPGAPAEYRQPLPLPPCGRLRNSKATCLNKA